jgi:hypothetical protein
MPDPKKHFEAVNPNRDFSHTSLLDNEKLLTLTNLDSSSGTTEWVMLSAFPLPPHFVSVLQ